VAGQRERTGKMKNLKNSQRMWQDGTPRDGYVYLKYHCAFQQIGKFLFCALVLTQQRWKKIPGFGTPVTLKQELELEQEPGRHC
jgi:hypothetical protein